VDAISLALSSAM